MTEFREDLEHWTDELINTNNDLAVVRKMRFEELKTLNYEDYQYMRSTLERMSAQIHWLDRTVNHYPKPPKKFWQFWKK